MDNPPDIYIRLWNQKQPLSSPLRSALNCPSGYAIINFHHGRWNQLNMPQQAFLIQQWRVKELNLEYNEQELILREIQLISFPFLTTLNLAGNCIQTIEILSNIHLPSLQHLDLQNNFLTQIQDLRKVCTKQLMQLKLWNNKLTEFRQVINFRNCKNLMLWVYGFNEDARTLDCNWGFRIACEDQLTIKVKKREMINRYERLCLKMFGRKGHGKMYIKFDF